MTDRGTVITTATVERGELRLRNGRAFREAVARFPDGSPLVVSVTRLRAQRSLQANAYYWSAVVGTLSEHTGYTPDEVHELLKMKFLPKRLAMCDGNGEVRGEFVIGGSTTRLDNLEFSDYIRAIRIWAAEDLDVTIPDANEVESCPA